MVRVRRTPQRQCVGCGEMKGKKELIRVVRAPDGQVSIDPTGKKSGRGAYICPQAACLEQALKKKQLERRLEAAVPADLVERLRAQLSALGSGRGS